MEHSARRDRFRIGLGRSHLGLLPVADDPTELALGDEGPLHPNGRRGVRRLIQHVTLAQQSLGAGLVDNDAAVYRRSHRKGNASREVGLDDACNDVHRGPLGSDDQVNSSGAGQLSQPRNHPLSFIGRHHHQVGQLVDHDHDIRHGVLMDRPHAVVVVRDIADAFFGEPDVAAVHLT